MRLRLRAVSLGIAAAAVALGCSAALAQTSIDVPTVDVVDAGHGKVRLTITAGSMGAPAGFQVSWMPSSQFDSQGQQWTFPWAPNQGWVDYTGTGTLNTWGSAQVDFKLAPFQSLDVEVGDTRGETGVTGTISAELTENTEYVFVAVAHGAGMNTDSPLSLTMRCGTTSQGSNCTYTIGFWKNHAGSWPTGSLTLGSVSYSASQLLSILGKPVSGNGLISLAHQLIAAKLNIANGANPSSIASTISSADALIGGLVVPPIGSGSLAPGATSSFTQALDDFNNGLSGPGHCGSTPTRTSTWGSIKLMAR